MRVNTGEGPVLPAASVARTVNWVGAFTQIDRWREGPRAVAAGDRRANSDRAVIDGYGGAWFGGARELRTRIVSAASAAYRSFAGINIVRCAANGGRAGRNRIDNKTDGSGCRAGACRIGRGCGNGVAAPARSVVGVKLSLPF